MPQPNQRQGFLLSALVHVIMITALIRTATRSAPLTPAVSPVVPEPRRRAVFLPPPDVLRRMAPPRQPAPTTPRPIPTPLPTPPREARDRISIGPPSELKRREP